MTAPGERYIHGHSDSVLRSHRWRTAREFRLAYLLPHLAPDGQRLLDVGCGPGTLTVDLAGGGSASAVVAGIDLSPASWRCRRKRRRHRPAGAGNVTFRTGDFRALEATRWHPFDVVHAHQVLQHLRDPFAALAEMRRVTKAGRRGGRAGHGRRLDRLVPRRAGARPMGGAVPGSVTRSNGGEPGGRPAAPRAGRTRPASRT